MIFEFYNPQGISSRVIPHNLAKGFGAGFPEKNRGSFHCRDANGSYFLRKDMQSVH